MTTTANPNDCGKVSDTDSLWQDVQNCITNPPGKCLKIDSSKNREWVVLEGTQGSKTHYKLLPTARITGIECPTIWEHDTPNYWNLAWNEVANEKNYYWRKNNQLDRIGMAINAKQTHSGTPTRDNAQLHIHVSCIHKDVQDTLKKEDPNISNKPPNWSKLKIGGYNYRVLRLDADTNLANHNLFRLVYNFLFYEEYKKDEKKVAENMQYQTLIVVKRPTSTQYKGEGFYILNSDTITVDNPGIGDGERLLDETCS